MPKLLVATHNRGKLREIRSLLQDVDVALFTPQDLGLELKVEENGATYADNAALKAIAFARAGRMLSLADDSGLEVAALDRQPGIRSARFAPQANATDADRRAYLLQRLEGKPRPWLAQFRAVVALALPPEAGEKVNFAEGICSGEIISEERGRNGFGYDPIFWLPEFGKTMAELTMEEKNLVSHRARAIKASLTSLIDLLRRGP